MILQDAKGCLLEKGLDDTTVRDIAAWCGLSPGTLTYHFDSVDDILVEVLAEASAEYLATNLSRARTGLSASERLTGLLTGGLPADDAARRCGGCGWRAGPGRPTTRASRRCTPPATTTSGRRSRR
jgi:AcrR family transcriptional regulator